MARYIDANKLINEIDEWLNSVGDVVIGKGLIGKGLSYYGELMGCIEDTPTADVVEVVRCKECNVPHNKWTGCPRLSGLVTPPDFYCGFGERIDK